MWSGDPRLSSSTQLCQTASSYLRVDTPIQAAANKVSGTLVGPNPPGLGGVVQLTVYGQGTGTIGAGPSDDLAVFWMTPAAVSSWQPNLYKLTKTRLYIDPDGTGALTETLYTDQLRLNNFTGGDRPYRIIYTFVAIGVTVQAGDFGTTSADLNGDGDILDVGETTTNSGLLDTIRDVLPAGTSFVSGSATWKGAAIPDPANSSGTLAFAGPFSLASNTTPVLSYRLSILGTGTYTNSANAYVGATRIDTTLLTTDNVPATATVQVGPTTATLTRSAASTTFGTPVTLTTIVGPESPTGTVTFTDNPPSGTAITLGTASVVSDVATLTTTLPRFGLNTITASYGGDGTHTTAASNSVTVEVAAYDGEVIVTERRTAGPGGVDDSYVELHNTGPDVPLGGFVVRSDSGASVTVPTSAGTLGHRRYSCSSAASSASVPWPPLIRSPARSAPEESPSSRRTPRPPAPTRWASPAGTTAATRCRAAWAAASPSTPGSGWSRRAGRPTRVPTPLTSPWSRPPERWWGGAVHGGVAVTDRHGGPFPAQ